MTYHHISPNGSAGGCFPAYYKEATNMYVDSEKLNMVINGEGIYVDYCEDGDAGYEDDELVNVDIDTPSFYLICYSYRNLS